jgi:hypothetical protein
MFDCALGDVVATVDDVTVNFMGSSGGMKIFETDSPDGFLMVQQDKLREYTQNGSQTNNQMNMAGGGSSWSALETTQTNGVSHYKTTFTKTATGKKFQLIAHISKGEVTTTEEVPCSACQSGSGVCKSTSNVCSDAQSDGACASGSTKCTETIAIKQDELKFSIVIAEWDWKNGSTTNRLHYALELKQKDGGGDPKASDSNGNKVVTVGSGAKIVLESKAQVVGGSGAATEVDVNITTGMQGSKYIIEFDFPNFGTKGLYYDPTMSAASSSEDDHLTKVLIGLSAALVVSIGAFMFFKMRKRKDIQLNNERSSMGAGPADMRTNV